MLLSLARKSSSAATPRNRTYSLFDRAERSRCCSVSTLSAWAPRESFTGAVSGTDLIVGSRSSPLQLTLYTVFGIGSGVAGVSSPTWKKYSRHPAVEWTAPLAFGDSYRGFRVLGTNDGVLRTLPFPRWASPGLPSG